MASQSKGAICRSNRFSNWYKGAILWRREERESGVESRLTFVKVHVSVEIGEGTEVFGTVTTGVKVLSIRSKERSARFISLYRFVYDAQSEERGMYVTCKLATS